MYFVIGFSKDDLVKISLMNKGERGLIIYSLFEENETIFLNLSETQNILHYIKENKENFKLEKENIIEDLMAKKYNEVPNIDDLKIFALIPIEITEEIIEKQEFLYENMV